jgi:cytochrome P450
MDDEMLRLTMSVIGRAMFAIDLSQEMTEVGAALQEAFGFIPTRATSIVPLSVPLPTHQRFKKNLDLINRFVAERIEEGRRSTTQETLLSILLHAQDEETGHRMTDEQLRDEVVTLFFAGFETTARSLTWGWSLLTRHPDALARLEAEADRVIGLQRPSVEDLFNLTWTRQVIDETLRIYPPTALLARQASEDDVIGGYPVKAGSMIILVPYIVHRHRDFWANADVFDPERFTSEADAARPRSAYIPFASGPRVCLGNNFALLEMVYAYAMAAARYHVEAVDTSEITHEFGGTIRPTRRLSVRVRER